MANELQMDTGSIVVWPGTVLFPDYERLKLEAQELSAAVSELEVTDENIKLSKKMLAAVNNRIKEIESKRIQIKKDMLAPYNEFETQVKEIIGIVKEADQLVRDQVRELEELDRERKKKAIEVLFLKRRPLYTFQVFMDFEDFLQARHLNKTTTMTTIEAEMVQWMEKIENDITVIRTLPNQERIITEYLDTKDVATAIRVVQEYDERLQAIREAGAEPDQDEPIIYTLTLFNSRDTALVENFMWKNQIKYEKVAK